MVGSPLQSASPKEKEKKGENSHKGCMDTLSFGNYSPIYRHLVCGFFIKALINISIFTNIHISDMCNLISPYISLVNNSIDQIIP